MARFMGFTKGPQDEVLALVEGRNAHSFAADGNRTVNAAPQQAIPESAFVARHGIAFDALPREYKDGGYDIGELKAALAPQVTQKGPAPSGPGQGI